MPVYTSGERRGLPRPLSRKRGHGVWRIFGEPCAKDFVRIRVPGLRRLYVCHRKAAPVFEAAFAELERQGLEDLIDPKDFDGFYACRRVRGGASYSPHAWAIAFDYNVHWLHVDGKDRRTKRWNYRCTREEVPERNVLLAHRVFLKFGMSCGVWWSFMDPMHVEVTDISLHIVTGAPIDERTWALFQERLRHEQQSSGLHWRYIDGKPLVTTTESPPKVVVEGRIIDGRVWVPVRKLMEPLGYDVLAHRLKQDGKVYIRRRPP